MTKIKYSCKLRTVTEMVGLNVVTSKKPVILEEVLDDSGNVKLSIPSALNQLLTRWKLKSITNAKNHGDTIVSFLNYVKNEVATGDDEEFTRLKNEGFYGLDFYHGQQFLKYCIEEKKVNLNTAGQYTQRVLDLYETLIGAKLLKTSVVLEDRGYITSDNEERVKRINPFNYEPYVVSYPRKKNIKDRKLVNMDDAYWQLFLRVAEKHQPSILLGISLQMFGGLRRGEVVNLITNDIEESRLREKDTSILGVNVKDRSNELFKDRKGDLTRSRVKKERQQQVFNFNGRLYEYYEIHMKHRAFVLRKNGKLTPALFINKDGEPMTGDEYSRAFASVKRKFMNALEDVVYKDYLKLRDMSWSTHIGRGIFTNLCYKYKLAKNAKELQNLRGDDNIKSSAAYIDEFKKLRLVQRAFDKIVADMNNESRMRFKEYD